MGCVSPPSAWLAFLALASARLPAPGLPRRSLASTTGSPSPARRHERPHAPQRAGRLAGVVRRRDPFQPLHRFGEVIGAAAQGDIHPDVRMEERRCRLVVGLGEREATQTGVAARAPTGTPETVQVTLTSTSWRPGSTKAKP